MASGFARVPDEEWVYRLADPGGAFLPEGVVLPLPAWLRPTRADVQEAEARGRRPGLSVWRRDYTKVVEARKLANKPRGLAFTVQAGGCRRVGSRAGIDVDVVADPLHAARPAPGWDGHALVEGLARPPGAARSTYRNLRAALAERFRPWEDAST